MVKYMNKVYQNDKELIELKPIIFGGDPNDTNNKLTVSRKEHIEYVKYWNSIIDNIRKEKII